MIAVTNVNNNIIGRVSTEPNPNIDIPVFCAGARC